MPFNRRRMYWLHLSWCFCLRYSGDCLLHHCYRRLAGHLRPWAILLLVVRGQRRTHGALSPPDGATRSPRDVEGWLPTLEDKIVAEGVLSIFKGVLIQAEFLLPNSGVLWGDGYSVRLRCVWRRAAALALDRRQYCLRIELCLFCGRTFSNKLSAGKTRDIFP